MAESKPSKPEVWMPCKSGRDGLLCYINNKKSETRFICMIEINARDVGVPHYGFNCVQERLFEYMLDKCKRLFCSPAHFWNYCKMKARSESRSWLRAYRTRKDAEDKYVEGMSPNFKDQNELPSFDANFIEDLWGTLKAKGRAINLAAVYLCAQKAGEVHLFPKSIQSDIELLRNVDTCKSVDTQQNIQWFNFALKQAKALLKTGQYPNMKQQLIILELIRERAINNEGDDDAG